MRHGRSAVAVGTKHATCQEGNQVTSKQETGSLTHPKESSSATSSSDLNAFESPPVLAAVSDHDRPANLGRVVCGEAYHATHKTEGAFGGQRDARTLLCACAVEVDRRQQVRCRKWGSQSRELDRWPSGACSREKLGIGSIGGVGTRVHDNPQIHEVSNRLGIGAQVEWGEEPAANGHEVGLVELDPVGIALDSCQSSLTRKKKFPKSKSNLSKLDSLQERIRAIPLALDAGPVPYFVWTKVVGTLKVCKAQPAHPLDAGAHGQDSRTPQLLAHANHVERVEHCRQRCPWRYL